MIEVRYEDAVAALATATNWRKASYSQGQNECVEVGYVLTAVGVRDSKCPGRPILAFNRGSWAAFTAATKQ